VLSINAALAGLPPLTYHFRAVATNSAGTNFGGDQLFTTIVPSLGTTNLVEGPAPGMDSVLLTCGLGWTATNNAPWLHLDATNQSGTGSTNVIFSFDLNTGPARTDTLTIAGQTLTVTQAGSNYVAASFMMTLASAGINSPRGVAVDGKGNVYIADQGSRTIKKLLPGSTNVTTLNLPGLVNVSGVGVNVAGTALYVCDPALTNVWKWTFASGAAEVLHAELSAPPLAVAVDAADNAYVLDFNGVVTKWSAAGTVTTLTSLGSPQFNAGVAVDALGNVYVSSGGGFQAWSAANNTWSPLPFGGQPVLAVDGGGNVYYLASSSLQVWSPATTSSRSPASARASTSRSSPFFQLMRPRKSA